MAADDDGREKTSNLSFRLPDAARVGGVRLLVSNMARSLEYYEHVLGLRVYSAAQEHATLGPHGGDVPLATLESRPGTTRANAGAFGLFHFALLLPDRASLGRFAAHLSTLEVRVGMADHLVSEALYLRDPDGLGIEVYADRARSTWRHRDGELVMTTDPLNINDVIAEARGSTWNGMPRHTTMGHVHLHVGDLRTAENYYHRALGFDKTVWSYPGALFMAAGGYHHHLATNTWAPGPSAPENTAQLLNWEIVLPASGDVAALAHSVRSSGYAAEEDREGLITTDPWGTRLRVR